MHVHHWSLYVSLSLSSITLLYHHPEIHTRANTSVNRHTKNTRNHSSSGSQICLVSRALIQINAACD